MDTLVWSANFSRRLHGYKTLNQDQEFEPENRCKRTFSIRKHQGLITSLSYRQARAKARQVFLRSYNLASRSTIKRSKRGRVEKVVIKARMIFVSLVSVLRNASFKSCSSRSAICSSPPMRVTKCC